MNVRPQWCPHQDCAPLSCVQDGACTGRLPRPEPHGDGLNTHRLCIQGAKDDGSWTFDLQIHSGDAWWLKQVLDAVTKDAHPEHEKQARLDRALKQRGDP